MSSGCDIIKFFLDASGKAKVDYIWEMLYQAIHVTEGVEPPSRYVLLQPEIRRYLQDWGQPQTRALVAVDPATSSPIGAVWLGLWVGDQKGYGYVDGVTPELTPFLALLLDYKLEKGKFESVDYDVTGIYA